MVVDTCMIFTIISGIILFLYFTNNKYRDMERYYLNHDVFKYKLLLYSKYVLIFACMYNAKYALFASKLFKNNKAI